MTQRDESVATEIRPALSAAAFVARLLLGRGLTVLSVYRDGPMFARVEFVLEGRHMFLTVEEGLPT